MASVLTVSQLNIVAKSVLDGEPQLRSVMVSGELSNFNDRYKSGHMYFSLKDQGGVIGAVMFSSSAKRLRFMPKDGMKVIVAGSVSIYPATGKYQINVQSMQPDGIGALNLAYEQLKEKLFNEGLFEKKRSLPEFPKRVAVITSPTGAAVRDISNTLARRWPIAEVILCPSAVQGELAEGQLVSAVNKINDYNLADVIIIGRGGGSIEELWAFNSELLARTIFDSKIPVISAVGHEINTTICDFVADVHAITPTEAAEFAVPNMYAVMSYIDGLWEKMSDSMDDRMKYNKITLDRLASSKKLTNPDELLTNKYNKLKYLTERMTGAQSKVVGKNHLSLAKISGRLDELSPLKTLSRGYSVVTNKENKIINSVNAVEVGEFLDTLMTDGKLEIEVKRKYNG